MKRYLVLVCFILALPFWIKQPLAKTHFMPDYQRNLVGKRVNDGGKSVGNKTCATYGYVSQCPGNSAGTKVIPVSGLTCYKGCKSCKDFGLSESCGDKNVLAPGMSVRHPIPGLNCYNRQMDCKCPDEYKYGEANNYTCTLGGDICYDTYHHGSPVKNYTQCTCGSQYKYLGEPNAVAVVGRAYTKCFSPMIVGGSSCSFPGTGSYKLATGRTTTIIELYTECTCPAGYTFDNGTCVQKCADYPLTVCPTGCNCSSCPDNSGKYKIDSAKNGYQVWEGTCVAKSDCPLPYICGVTSCAGNEAKPNYHKHATAKCGDKVCGYCSCDNTKDCSAYTLAVKSDANAVYSSCSTGCPLKTTYKFDGCKDGYELKNGKCERITCASGGYKDAEPAGQACTKIAYNGLTCYKDCVDTSTCASGGYKDTVPAGQVCTKINYNGLTCYKDCVDTPICKGFYADTDGILYNGSIPVGIKYASGYYLLNQSEYRRTSDGFSSDQEDFCWRYQEQIPDSAEMTDVLSLLGTKLSDEKLKNVLSQKLWWTNSLSGNYVLKNGTVVGGGGCAGTGHWKRQLADGSCQSFEDKANCSASSKYICSYCSTPSVICIKDCEETYCPSGYAYYDACPAGYETDLDADVITVSSGKEGEIECGKCKKIESSSGGDDETLSTTPLTLEVTPASPWACDRGDFRTYHLYIEIRDLEGKMLSSVNLDISTDEIANANEYGNPKITKKFTGEIPYNQKVMFYIQTYFEDQIHCGLCCSATFNQFTVNGQNISSMNFDSNNVSHTNITFHNYLESKVKIQISFGNRN